MRCGPIKPLGDSRGVNGQLAALVCRHGLATSCDKPLLLLTLVVRHAATDGLILHTGSVTWLRLIRIELVARNVGYVALRNRFASICKATFRIVGPDFRTTCVNHIRERITLESRITLRTIQNCSHRGKARENYTGSKRDRRASHA